MREEMIEKIRQRAYFEQELDKAELFDLFVSDIRWLLEEDRKSQETIKFLEAAWHTSMMFADSMLGMKE